MPSRISQMRNEQVVQQTPPLNPQAQPQFQIDENYLNELKTVMHSGNSQQALINMMAQNPQMRSVLQMIQSGGNPQKIFEQLARQKGVDPNYILNKLMG